MSAGWHIFLLHTILSHTFFPKSRQILDILHRFITISRLTTEVHLPNVARNVAWKIARNIARILVLFGGMLSQQFSNISRVQEYHCIYFVCLLSLYILKAGLQANLVKWSVVWETVKFGESYLKLRNVSCCCFS